jgi:hypothetical protein
MNEFSWATIIVFVMAVILTFWVQLLAYNVAMNVVKIIFGG